MRGTQRLNQALYGSIFSQSERTFFLPKGRHFVLGVWRRRVMKTPITTITPESDL